jgi:GPH family glycoside/pentoside/hexuronide:cation symporter
MPATTFEATRNAKSTHGVYTTQRLSWKEKIGHAFAEFGENLVSHASSFFGLVFLTDVVGIPAALAGTLGLILRLLDGAFDFVSGWLLDNVRLRLPGNWAKGSTFRPWIVVTTPLFVLATVLQYAVPGAASLAVKVIWVYGLAFVAGFAYDFVNGGQVAVLARMTQRPRERNQLSALKGAFMLLASAIVMFMVPWLKDSFPTLQIGYLWTFGVLGTSMLAAEYVAVALSKERIEPIQQKHEGKYRPKEMLRILWQNKPFLVLTVQNVFDSIASGLLSASSIYYLTYYFGSEEIAGPVTVSGGALILPGAFLAAPLARKIGKKNTLLLAMAISTAGHALRFFAPQGNLPFLIAASLPGGIGIGLAVAIRGSMVADTVEYGEWETGKRTEGAFGALGALVNKLTLGLGGTLVAWTLAWSGFAPNAEQGSSALMGIRLVISLAPALLVCLGMLTVGLFYPLTEDRFARVVVDLKARKPRNGDGTG